jgi:hypothetical protein
VKLVFEAEGDVESSDAMGRRGYKSPAAEGPFCMSAATRSRTLFGFLSLLTACGYGDPAPGSLDTFEIDSENTGTTYTVEVFAPGALTDRDGATVMYVFDGVENADMILAEYATALDDGV